MLKGIRMKAVATILIAITCAAAQTSWQPLFDGKSLAGWKVTPFTGAGPAKAENGAIVIGPGKPLAGVTYTGEFPKTNYEIRFEAMKREGGDFFASLTFPVGDSFCTLVTGGWGGDIVGVSSIDGWDASDNETRSYFTFEPGHWYTFRVQVTDARLQAWIDDRQVANVEIGGRKVSLRYGEIKLSAPLGVASYNSIGVVRKIEYRRL
jgi:hypothetical protein